MNKPLQYDDFIKDSDWITDSPYQRMFVLINGKEYPIKEWYTECDPEWDTEHPDLREECNQRIVFEI